MADYFPILLFLRVAEEWHYKSPAIELGFVVSEPWQMPGLFYGAVLMAEPSTGALAVTGVLASVGLGAPA
ncbi:hypothetical protein EC849_102174 [Pseudomonas putida]|uniref:hypothetical protein n=1 Tax=Pseudomonas putida TaxID=303 RepID=UPI00104F54B5|nr:hypothetical protein [Pseudomonas putida]TCP78339.1 hypothetical protein EC849_102174 [Pseudomonas putida]